MPRAAAIDIGTNTVLLTIAERRAGAIVASCERATITRLGAGVDRTRAISDEARARTVACLEEYAELIAAHGVGSGSAFLDDAERVLGVRPRVVTGSEEAELTFEGSLSGLSLEGDVLVFDVGGGSTELVLGNAGAGRAIASLDIGSVRLFERHVASDPPTFDELERARAAVREALASCRKPAPGCQLVGVAGTVTTLACLRYGTSVARAGEVHGTRLASHDVERLARELASLSLAARLGLGGLDPGRADVIPVGAALVSEICRWAGASELLVSDRGVRWGLLERRLAG